MIRALVLLAVLLLGSTRARAQEDPQNLQAQLAEDEARALFSAGLAAYDAARYDDALAHFQRAFERSGRPELLFNVGQCQDRLRQDEQAIVSFERYLALLPDASNRFQVEGRIRALREGLARRSAAGTQPTDRATAPAPQPETAVPSPAEVARRAPDTTAEAPRSPAPLDDTSNPHRGRRIALITTASVVAVAAAVLTVLLVRGADDGYEESDVGLVVALRGGRR